MRLMHHALLAALGAACLALAACGGGGGGSAPEEEEPVARNLPPRVDRLLSSLHLSRDSTESTHGVREDAFVDPEGEPVTIAAESPDGTPLPDWIAFDPATRMMVINQTGAPVGVTTIRFRGTDPAGGTAQFLTSIHVPGGTFPSGRSVISRPDGPGQADADSYDPSVSGLGFHVAFRTHASNLHPAQTGNVGDVLVRHVWDGTVEQVNSSPEGLDGPGSALRPSIAFDGRKVAFQDTTPWIGDPTDFHSDIFLKDLDTGDLTWLSPPLFGSLDDGAYAPAITPEADLVTFTSGSGLLVADDSNATYDVFVRDVDAAETTRASLLADGAEAFTGYQEYSAISADGRFVAFVSDSGEFHGTPGAGKTQIVLKDRWTGAVEIVSRNANGQLANEHCSEASLSADGRFVAFQTRATNLDSQDTDDLADVYVRDRWTGDLRWVTENEGGAFPGPAGGGSRNPTLSADGRFLCLESNRRILSLDDNDAYDVYVKVLYTGTWRLLTQRTVAGVTPGDARGSTLSANAAAAAFSMESDDLSTADTNGHWDVVWANSLVRGATHRDDSLQGTSGDDWIRGLTGHDRILGQEGNDLIEPGPGVDEMRGGIGVDTYLWWNLEEAGDCIVDFQTGILGDRLDLRRLLPAGASAAPADHLRFVDDGVNTRVEVDVDGPGGAPFVLLVLLRDVSPFTLAEALADDQLLLP